MGFHTAREIPNYWKYAKRYTLQDRMFAPSDSWTLPAHLFLVSGWSATCTDLDNWRSCHSDQKFPGGIWADGDAKMWTPADGCAAPVHLGTHHVAARQGGRRLGLLRGSRHVHRAAVRRAPRSGDRAGAEPAARVLGRGQEPTQLGNVRPNTEFFDAAADGTLPPVSWVMPTSGRGEHPPDYIGNGQAWVTSSSTP